MTRQLLYMGRPPADAEARLEWALAVYVGATPSPSVPRYGRPLTLNPVATR